MTSEANPRSPGGRTPAPELEAEPVFTPGAAGASVSVVIPARNEEAYIEAALASVLGQSFPLERLECVVVDNASADRTAETALAFASRHPQIKVSVVSEPGVGAARAKNRGARAAQGRILLFLDADSRMDGNLIHDVVTTYEEGSPAGCIRIVADSRDRLERGFFDLMELGKILFGIRTQMLYCDRRLFFAIDGFRPELRVAEDLDLMKRAQKYLSRNGGGTVSYIRTSAIATSPRRLRTRPYRLSLVTVFVRWALAFVGIGRRRSY